MKSLPKYLKNRKENIDSLLDIPENKYTSGTFHKLRLEIKKLNALLDLLNFCASDFKYKKTFEPFKLIFGQAGKVRELQLEEAMFKKYLGNKSLKGYRRSLKEQRLKEQNDFYSLITKKLVKRLEIKYRKTTTFLNEVNNKSANRYLEMKINKIKKLLGRRSLRPEQIHELRKRLKILNYNLKSLNFEKQKQTVSKKEILPGLLGKWHDCQVMSGHLAKAIEGGKINKKEINLLNKVKRKVDSDCERLISKINKAMDEQMGILKKNYYF